MTGWFVFAWFYVLVKLHIIKIDTHACESRILCIASTHTSPALI